MENIPQLSSESLQLCLISPSGERYTENAHFSGPTFCKVDICTRELNFPRSLMHVCLIRAHGANTRRGRLLPDNNLISGSAWWETRV